MAGSVRLDIVAQAQDQATATMRKVSQGLNQVSRDTKALGIEQQKASGAMGKMQAAFGTIKGAVGKAAASLAVFGLAVEGLKTAAGAVTSVVGSVSELANAGREIEKTAKSVGLSAEQYQRLQGATRLTGDDLQAVLPAFAKLGRVVRDAATGQGEAAKKMERIGISATTATGSLKGATDVFFEIADRFRAMEDGAEKSALALDFFEESGFKLIPFLNRGSEGIRELGNEAQSLGVVLSDDVIAESTEAATATARFDLAIEGLTNSLSSTLLPVLTDAADGLTEIVKALNSAEKTAQQYGQSLAQDVTEQQAKGTQATEEFIATLERLAKEGRSNAEVEEALAQARAEGGEAMDLANRIAAKYFDEARTLAEDYYKTQDIGAEVAAKAAEGEERVAQGVAEKNVALERAVAAIKAAREQEALQIDLAKAHVAIVGGATLNTLALAAAQREFAAATKEGSKASAEQIKVLAMNVEAAAAAVADDKRRKDLAKQRAQALRKVRAQLEQLRLAQQGYVTARDAGSAADRAGIALETKLMQIAAQRERRQISAADATLERAKAEFAYVKARDKATAADAKAAVERGKRATEEARAVQTHQLDLQLLELERAALDDLTAVERAALDVARQRLDLQRQEVNALESVTAQKRAMELATERVTIAEQALGMAIKEQDLEAHAARFADVNAVMAQSSGLLSGLSVEAGAVATGIGDLSNAIGLWGESQQSQTAAVDGSIAAGQKLTGALIKDEKKQAAILGAMEIARAAAAFATGNIPRGAAHLASAALFGAVAGGAIGGGRGGGGTASSRADTGAGFQRSDAGGGEAKTQQVVVSFGDGIVLGTPGQVGKAVAQATGALGGTGMQTSGAF